MELTMPSEVATWVEELAKCSGLSIDDPDGDLFEIAEVCRNSMESTEMTTVDSEATGADAEAVGLANGTT